MKINITEDFITLESFLELLNSSSNIKDMYLICHQGGCPVYVIRNKEEMCEILWHPSKIEENNIIKARVEDSIFELIYKEQVQPFTTLEELRKDYLANHMLGENPFDEKFIVWKNKRTI